MPRTKLSFLFPDDIHFHERSFKTLFDFLEIHNIPHVLLREHRDLKLCYGDYSNQPQIRSYLPHLETLDKEALYSFTYNFRARPLQIFPIVQAEALCHLLATRENWYGAPLPGYAEVIFAKMYAEERETLLLNMAAAMFWIDYLEAELARLPNITHCCIFGGCAIYTKVLTKLLMTTSTKVMMMESSVTGNEYYFEEKYEPIPNNYDIRFPNVYQSIRLPEDPNLYDRERMKATDRFLEARYKNVTQPTEVESFEPFKRPDKETVLIIGQAQNDFSLLEAKLPNINSIDFYKALVRRLLDQTDVNIIFRVYPREHRQAPPWKPLTKNELERLRSSLTPDRAERLRILENRNIRRLFDYADYLITLNSQSALDAAFYGGLKPIVFGKPFFGNKGFTHDYEDIESFHWDFIEGRVRGSLTLSDYEAFEEFLTKWLQFQLVTVKPQGIGQLEAKLGMSSPLTVAQPWHSSEAKAFGNGKSAIAGIAANFALRRWDKFTARVRRFQCDPYPFLRDRGFVPIGSLLSFLRSTRRR